ncbi:hypothetical protein HDV06_005266 [Boothiomyces sp. JEL0866]|nr:hypothetical protein HDV06_005266 [Boothiomyces sp. JEL0866]
MPAYLSQNRVRNGWTSTQNQITNEEKQWVKQHIIQAIANTTGTKKHLLLNSVHLIISSENMHNSWPELNQAIVQLLQSQDSNLLYTGLAVLLELVKTLQWTQAGKRANLYAIIQSLFPILLSIGQKLEQIDNPESLLMLKTIVKTYNCSIRMDLSPVLQSMDSLVPWCTLFMNIVQKKSGETDEKHVFWKLKKWAFSCLNTLMGKYGRRKGDKKYVQFSKLFVEHFVPKILTVYFQQFEQNSFSSPRTIQLQLSFIGHCIGLKPIWPMILEKLELLVKFIFPLLCFTEQDQELWDEDPVEYIHKKVDPPIDDFRSPVTAAEELLVSLVKSRFSQTFIPIVTMVNSILNTLSQQFNPNQKYGAMNIMAQLADMALSEKSPIKDQMEQFLVSHVFPDLTSPHAFLRAKACDVIHQFSEINYKEESNLQFAFTNILNCMNDAQLPVRVSSSLALGPFLKYPQVVSAMKPHVVQVMQGLLNTTNEIDLDTLTHSMELLVFEFSEELKPYATQLASQLRDTFLRIMAEGNFNSDDFDIEDAEDKTMAAMGVLKTIASLILSVDSSPAIILEIELVIEPALKFILENSILDLYEELFEIIETSLFCAKQVSPTMWNLFPYIYNTFKQDALEYLEEMSPSLDNYISYGKDVIAANPTLQNQLFEMIMTIMNDKLGREADKIRAIQLMETMLHNLRGLIDSFVPQFVEQAYNLLKKKVKTVALRVHCIEVVLNAIYYNPTMTLGLLEHINWTTAFCEIWFKNIDHFHRVHDKKLSILALCTLLELPQNQLGSLQNMWTHLFDARESMEGEPEEYEDYDNNDDFEDAEEFDDQEQETLETLANDAAQAHTEDYSDDEEWDVEEFMQEDIYFITPLDPIDAYIRFTQTMNHLQQTGQGSILDGRLSTAQRATLNTIVATAQKNQQKQ